MKIISYYTSLYQWDAQQLIQSLRRCGIEHFNVEERPQLGSWARNTQYKAPFILEQLSAGDPVVWTDADSRIRQVPTLFDTLVECDVAFFYLKQSDTPEFSPPANCKLPRDQIAREGYLQSGTMLFNHTPRTIELINRWISLNEEDHEQWDQWNLQLATADIEDLKIATLPPEYVWIQGVSSNIFGARPPVIEHLQASRKYKKRLK